MWIWNSYSWIVRLWLSLLKMSHNFSMQPFSRPLALSWKDIAYIIMSFFDYLFATWEPPILISFSLHLIIYFIAILWKKKLKKTLRLRTARNNDKNIRKHTQKNWKGLPLINIYQIYKLKIDIFLISFFNVLFNILISTNSEVGNCENIDR